MIYDATQIEAAVRSICPDIEQRVADAPCCREERSLWWELSACILSSQVPYGLATAAADALDTSSLLFEAYVSTDIERPIYAVLSKPLAVDGRTRAYRFPAVRAAQLACAHGRVHREAGTLSRLLSQFATARDARRWLVEMVPGLGPKQASMFLRNVGVTYDLAILDRHVLQYMAVTGLRQFQDGTVSSLSRYCQAEETLRAHAEAATCSVGIMDWAIWIVMRVAKQAGVQRA